MSQAEGKCQIYGDRRDSIETISVEIGLESKLVDVCAEHLVFFQNTPTDEYTIGFTFTGEVEVRKVPATPTLPTVTEPPAEG